MTTLSPSRRRWPAALLLLLAAAFALRMVLAVTLPGYPYDTGTFYSWAVSLAKEGPSVFYTSGFFADYPPGYLYVLWGAGLLLRALGIQGLSGGAMAVLCLFPTLCDLALAALLWRLALPRAGERAALAAAAAAAFNPAFLFDCAVWKQVDAALALALVLCFLLLSRGHWYAAALAYAAALLIKPQALLFGPPFALGYLLALPRPASVRAAGKAAGPSARRRGPLRRGGAAGQRPLHRQPDPGALAGAPVLHDRDLLPLRLGQRLQPHRAAGRQLAGRERPLSAAALEGLGRPFHPAADRGPRAGGAAGAAAGKGRPPAAGRLLRQRDLPLRPSDA